MSLIHLALLAKAVEKQRKTGARRASSKKNERKTNSYSSSDENRVTQETFLDDLLETDPEATKLFLLLKDCLKQINAEDYQKSLEEVQTICAEYEEQYSLLEKEKEKLEKLGITLDDSSVLTKYYRSVKVKEGMGFGSYGSYSYNTARYNMGFNGMPITRKALENNENQFQISFENYSRQNPNLEEELAETKKKISKQKKSLKYSPFNREKKQSILTALLSIKKDLTEKIEKRNSLAEQSKAFDALTPEQKQAIIAYMDQVANCVEVGERLQIAINASTAIGRDYYGNNSDKERNVHQRMLERAAEQGDFTMEEIEAILARVKETMDENRVGYSGYKRIVDKNFSTYPSSPESMFASYYYDHYYRGKTKSKQ